MQNTHLILWASMALLVYTYLGYPALIRLWSALQPGARNRTRKSSTPSVTFVLVAYNEAERIRDRLENILHLDYPEGRLQVLVASDGSTDATVENARSVCSPLVSVIEFAERRGKAATLNDIVPQAWGEIVVFGDVRQRFETNALQVITATFADPETGAVSGELMLTSDLHSSEIEEGMGFYWRYEKFIRRHESRVDSTVGSTGAIYAIRKRLFRPIPDSTILDDVLIPMQIARQGYRVRFEPDALAYDQTSKNAYMEFQRKLRTIAGNFQMFYLEPWLLNPVRNRLWVQTISHKGARLLSPACLCAALAANLFILGEPAYRYLLIAQILFYMVAAAGHLTRRAHWRPSFLNIPYTFCLLNLATVAALFSLLHGRQRATWKKTTG